MILLLLPLTGCANTLCSSPDFSLGYADCITDGFCSKITLIYRGKNEAHRIENARIEPQIEVNALDGQRNFFTDRSAEMKNGAYELFIRAGAPVESFTINSASVNYRDFDIGFGIKPRRKIGVDLVIDAASDPEYAITAARLSDLGLTLLISDESGVINQYRSFDLEIHLRNRSVVKESRPLTPNGKADEIQQWGLSRELALLNIRASDVDHIIFDGITLKKSN